MWHTLILWTLMGTIVRPSVSSFTTFACFCAFADKSPERNDITFGMLTYPDDLPSAVADGYSCHLMHSSTHWVCKLHTNCFGKLFIIRYADESKWLNLSLSRLMGIIVRLSVRPAFFIWVWVGLGHSCYHHGGYGDIRCHYWQNNLAIAKSAVVTASVVSCRYVHEYQYRDVIMSTMASLPNHLFTCRSKHQSSASLAFVRKFTGDRGIPRTNDQWHGNCKHDGVSNHQPHLCLPNHLFRCRSKKTSKLRVTGLCVGNSPVTGEFPSQMTIWWRHQLFPTHDVIVIEKGLGVGVT